MDILSYGAASKVAKQEKETREDVLGLGVEGSHPHVKARIDHLEKGIEAVNEQANKLIVNDAINIMKAHAKLNAIAKTTKYQMHNMVFDDLLDLSGIDTTKSSGYTHDATEGTLTAGTDCVIETKEEVTDVIPSKVILTLEKQEGLNTFSENLCVSGTAISYSQEKGKEAAGAFTKDPRSYNPSMYPDDTEWQSSTDNTIGVGKEFIGYIFSKERHIRKISITRTYYAKEVEVQHKIGDNWETVVSLTLPHGNGKAVDYILPESSPSKEWRMLLKKSTTSIAGQYWSVSYIEMFEAIHVDSSDIYSVSCDNGVTWEPITLDTLFYFSNSISPLDNKLRLKVELPTGAKLHNYALTWA